MLRELRRGALVAAVVVIGSALTPTSAYADGPLGLLLNDVLNTAGGVVNEAADTTGLNSIVDPDISATGNGIQVGVNVPSINTNAQVGVGGNSVASANANVAPGNGQLADVSLNTTIGSSESLTSVGAYASVGGGALVETALQAEVAGEDGLIDVASNTTVLDGTVVDLQLNATVAGESLLDTSVEASVLGNDPVTIGVDVGGGGATVTLPGAPLPENPLPGIPGTPGMPTEPSPNTPTTTPSATSASMPSMTPVSVDAPVIETLLRDAHFWLAPLADGSALPLPGAVTEAPAIPSIVTTPSAIVAASLLQPTLGDHGTGEPFMITPASAPVPELRASNGAMANPGIRFGNLGAASSALTFSSNSTNYNAPLGMLASLALLGAALLFLAGHMERFRSPASRVCLPAVPPG